MLSAFTESVVEEAALEWLQVLGYTILHGPDIAAGEPTAEREDTGYRDVILVRRLKQTLQRLNPSLPPEAIDDAFRKLTRADAHALVARNHALYRMLVEGVTVEYARADGSIAGDLARVIDFNAPNNNDWLAVNQFTIMEGQHILPMSQSYSLVFIRNGLEIENGGEASGATGAGEWKIEGPQHTRAATVEQAIIYVTRMRDESSDPVIRRNAAKTIAALKRVSHSPGAACAC